MSFTSRTARYEQANLKARQKLRNKQAMAKGVRFCKPKMDLDVDEIHHL